MSESEMGMVERVARALATAKGKDPDAPAWVSYPGAVTSGICWRDQYAELARAAIEALKHATPEMYRGWRSVNCTHGKDGMEEFTYFAGDYGNWLACHQAMLSAALSGEEGK